MVKNARETKACIKIEITYSNDGNRRLEQRDVILNGKMVYHETLLSPHGVSISGNKSLQSFIDWISGEIGNKIDNSVNTDDLNKQLLPEVIKILKLKMKTK